MTLSRKICSLKISSRTISALLALAVAFGTGACTVHNVPINEPLAANTSELPAEPAPNMADADGFMIALAFSGGGTRAAAYSFGVLRALDRQRVQTAQGPVSLLDRIDFVSGVSGGSVTAAYFGLKQRRALDDFRERFLLKNVEESFSTRVSIGNLARGLSGGVNDATHLPRWLNDNLFDGATLSAFGAQKRPVVWINASDIFNRTPFVFGPNEFNALCSDLNRYPIADAVAASAAVPLVFAPIVIQSYPGRCGSRLPEWAVRARANPNSPPLLKAYANALASYHEGTVKYAKLLDGGLVDNFGLSALTIVRLQSTTPYGPLTPSQAIKLRRVLVMVVDAGRGPAGDWVNKLDGPSGTDLVAALSDTAIDASVRASYTAFEQTMDNWRQQIVRWRCGLSAAQRRAYGGSGQWNCRDVQFFVARIGFDQLAPARAAQLNAVPTRFQLPQATVDELIAAGEETLTGNHVFQHFLRSTRR